uniref:arginine--tRNA ligase n=1 Tax=Hirondellea gigas TaxID=1518452 RepID=A0A2P2I596_9CRUS
MESQLDQITKHCENLERAADELSSRVTALAEGQAAATDGISDAEYVTLLVHNKKLKYRAQILQKGIAEYSPPKSALSDLPNSVGSTSSSAAPAKSASRVPPLPEVPKDSMCAILQHLEAVFERAVRVAFPQHTAPVNTQIQLSKMADYQCNVAMALAKILRQNPRVVGQAVLDAAGTSPLIANMQLSGSGFINITLSTGFIREQVTRLVTHGVTPPPLNKRKVAVDFSSPNIAKEMHVGHLRSTIIGDSICRLLEFLGHDVLRINHLGDWGTQFGMLIAHLQDRFPNYLKTPPAISDLQGFYKESKKRFDEDEQFKVRAYKAVVQLQGHDPDHINGWTMICDISKREFNKVYERLDVKLSPYGESFYQSRMEAIVADLEQRGLLEQARIQEDETDRKDDRKFMYSNTVEEPQTVMPLIMVKSDGGFTYDTSDMACIRYRTQELDVDWLIYVTDAGQLQHFKSFRAAAARAGYFNSATTRMDHVMFGVVLGEDRKKFKTRSGDTVRLVELLEEGLVRAEAILKEKGRDEALSQQEFDHVKEAVAYGCIKYADLCHDRTRDYVFSFDRMLDFKGNTAAYLLYALTRICSIARTAGVSSGSLLTEARKEPMQLEHEKEWKLARTLLKLPDVILKLTEDLYLHPLCEFLYEVSTVFSEFYDNCYCVEKDKDGNITKIHTSRLLLCEATATVFKQCLAILGIKTVERM